VVQNTLYSQNYTKVDSIVRKYPKTFDIPSKIAELVNKDFTIPEEKARAIYTWIALNISYDIKALESVQKTVSFSYRTEEEKFLKEKKIKEDLAIATLKSKKAVCQGYSTLYKVICDLVSLECEIISGTSKTKYLDIGILPKISDHAWNSVKINNEWKLIDATWGAGYLNESYTKFIPDFNDFYFFTSPDLFFLNHYPENKDWLFISMTEREFADLPLFYPYYFRKKIELVEPKGGIINVPKNNTIKVVLKNINNATVSINFTDERFAKIITPKIENEFYIYEVDCKRKSGSYLTIFLNNTSIITYKIK